MDATCRITVVRRSPGDAMERQVVVSIDGVRAGTLMYGDTLTRDVPAGSHRLRAHNTLVWKTAQVDLAPGQTAMFSVVNRPGRGTSGLLSILGARPLYLDLVRDE
ncbi:MAG: hypothetical protein M3R55_09620 [Acidobacteriota bacterium]|nr:hypothetical protein [Acidobacteriota bacterium]